MNQARLRAGTALWIGIALTLYPAARGISATPLGSNDGDLIYRARPGDTLIGLGLRLLHEPSRWRALQRLNGISHPRHIPLGAAIRIPYAWLRMRVETAIAADVSGTVLRDSKPLAAGTLVPQGSRIETGPEGSVTLALPDGSVVTLLKSSILRLKTLQQVSGEKSARDYQLQLEKGHLQTADKPQGKMGRFEIETPVAICAVRGTRFRTAFDPAIRSAADETLAGRVTVSGARSAVSIPAGFGTRVESNGAPLPPVRLLAAPDLAGISATNTTDRLRLEWPPVAAAIGYRVQVAPDPRFRTILADAKSADSRISLPAPPDGAFWLRVRAIDRLGLGGFDAVKAMTEHRLPPPPTALSPRSGARITGIRAAFSWTGGTAGARYRWQLARAADFPTPMMDREIDGRNTIAIDGVQPGRYVWRIAAIDARGEVGEWSAPRYFTQRPGPPVLQAPQIGRHSLKLSWSGAAALRYHVQISRDPSFAQLLVDRDVAVPWLSVPRPQACTCYARVQIIDSGVSDPYGAPRRFEVPVPLWVRIVLPIAAVALALSV